MSDVTQSVFGPGALLTRDNHGAISAVDPTMLAFITGFLEMVGLGVGRVIPVDGNADGSLLVQPNNGVGLFSFNGLTNLGAGSGLAPIFGRVAASSTRVGDPVDGSTANGRPFAINTLSGSLMFAVPAAGHVNVCSADSISGVLGSRFSYGVNPVAGVVTGRTPVDHVGVSFDGVTLTVDARDDDGVHRDYRYRNSPGWGCSAAPANAARRFLQSGGASVAVTATEPPSVWLAPRAHLITRLSVALGSAMAVDSLTFTVRANGGDTLAVVVIAAGATAGTTGGLTVVVPTNAKVTVAVNQSAAEANAALDARVTYEYQ